MSEWIDTKVDLPEKFKNVDIFVSLSKKNTSAKWRITDCHLSDDSSWYYYDKFGERHIVSDLIVTHWMPLPEPPEQNND